MSANVDQMFSVREVPWHREGIVLGDYPGSWAEARTQAGLDWDPISEPVYYLNGIDPVTAQPVYAEDSEWQRVAHSGTGATLCMARKTYQIIDHGEMGEIVEAVLASDGNVKYETAGSLDGGKAVWALALLDEPIVLPGDTSPTLPYIAVTTRHDGTAGTSLRATAVRIVCQNTFRAAEMEGERTGATFTFRHTKGWRDRIAEARDAITGVRREIKAYEALALDLLALPVTSVQRERFVRAFIPEPPAGLVSDRVMANVEQARTLLRSIFTSTTTEGVADTAYGCVQAAGEYLDHVRRARSWESRMNRTMLRPEPLKARALQLVRSITSES